MCVCVLLLLCREEPEYYHAREDDHHDDHAYGNNDDEHPLSLTLQEVKIQDFVAGQGTVGEDFAYK